jgi:hypothetical protein
MRLALAVLALSMALPFAAQAATPSPFEAELARQCPQAHLERMDQGDLGRLMQRFEATLPEAQRRAVQETVGQRCALAEAGVTCANQAGLNAYRRLGVLKAFVAAACAQAKP